MCTYVIRYICSSVTTRRACVNDCFVGLYHAMVEYGHAHESELMQLFARKSLSTIYVWQHAGFESTPCVRNVHYIKQTINTLVTRLCDSHIPWMRSRATSVRCTQNAVLLCGDSAEILLKRVDVRVFILGHSEDGTDKTTKHRYRILLSN